MTEQDRNKWMLRGTGVSRTYGMKKRYAICKCCREKINIALTQDTSGGYFCPKCQAKQQKGRRKHGNSK